MPEAVIDVSAMIEVLMGVDPDIELRRRVLLSQLAAPELFDVEALNVLRKLERAGTPSTEDAAGALADLAQTSPSPSDWRCRW